MKNDFFSLNRFGHLLKKTIVENWVSILGITAAAVFLMLVNFNINDKDFKSIQVSPILLLLFSTTILTAFLLNKFDIKSKSIDFLLFPASSLEKLLSVLIIVYFIHVVVFLAFQQVFAHYFLDGFLVEYNSNPVYEKPKIIPLNDEIFRATYKIIVFFQLFVTAGSFYFKKNALIKSALTVIILSGVIYGLNRLIGGLMLDTKINNSFPFTNIIFKKGQRIVNFVVMETKDSDLISYLFTFILPICILFISYFKLKEKEV
jgi:hypothetical protein